MRKILHTLTILLLVSCNSENAPDCFQNAGDIIQKEFNVTDFTEVIVFENIELIVTEGATQNVTVETGEFLMSDIDIKVENGKLLLKDNNGCNFTRDYGITKIFVTSPNLTKVRNSSQFTVRSNGVLNYESLHLISEDDSGDFHNVGIFNVEVNTVNLRVTINNLTTTNVSGATTNLRISHASGDGRFEGRNLLADNVTIFHRGTNDIIVTPQVSLDAELVSTGNVIVTNTPPEVSVSELFNGRVIFE